MPFEFGQFNEFSDSVAANDPVIFAIAKSMTLGRNTGTFYQAMNAVDVTLDSKQYDIYGRSKTSRNGVIGASNWDNDDTTGLSMSAAAVKGLTVGHVLEIGSERVIVKSVNRTNNTIDVLARGAAGTTAAAHTAGAAYKVVGFAGSDTDLKNVESVNEITNVFQNFIQTVFETFDWTQHADLVAKGLSETQASIRLAREAEIRVAEMLATMAINGKKEKQTSATTRYMAAGLLQQLTDTASSTREVLTYNASGVLTEAKLMAALKQVFENGAPDTIWCSPTVKTYINNLNIANSALALNANKNDHTGGGNYITHIDYEGAILAVRVDRDMPDANLAIVTQSSIKKGWLKDDGLRMCDEPTKSSREKRKSFQGSIGFMVEGVGQDHILVTGITGGPTERVFKTASAS